MVVMIAMMLQWSCNDDAMVLQWHNVEVLLVWQSQQKT